MKVYCLLSSWLFKSILVSLKLQRCFKGSLKTRKKVIMMVQVNPEMIWVDIFLVIPCLSWEIWGSTIPTGVIFT